MCIWCYILTEIILQLFQFAGLTRIFVFEFLQLRLELLIVLIELLDSLLSAAKNNNSISLVINYLVSLTHDTTTADERPFCRRMPSVWSCVLVYWFVRHIVSKSCIVFTAAQRSGSFWNGICHRIEVERTGGRAGRNTSGAR